MSANFTKKILICGGSGFIGSNFIRHLYREYPSYQLVNLDLLTYSGNADNLADIEAEEATRPAGERRYWFVRGDISDRRLLERVLSNSVDAVVNFAAESHVDRSLHSSFEFIRTNVMGVHALLEACRSRRIPRFVQISTDEVYGDIPEGYSTEESPLNPSNPYSASKASADILIKSYMRSHNFPAVIVRGSNNFGPYQYPEKLVPLAISNFLENKKVPVHGAGEHLRSWIYVLDFCRGIDKVLHSGRDNHVYNISGTPKSNLQILAAIHAALGLREGLEAYKTHTNDRPGADRRYAPDSGKIQTELGWAPQHAFEDDMRATVQWYLENENWWRPIKGEPVFIEHYRRQKEANYY